jgi:ubiquinone/menaquinone biosynthesis C-methylase UbiE
MKQADIFTESEGDAWLARNRVLVDRDPVSDAIGHLGLKPQHVLEVGCANGWRLAALRGKFGCEVNGVEPSMQGCIEAATRRVPVWRITAEALPAGNEAYDLVIYGFCLYLTDPIDWLKIAAEGDRVLMNGGHLIIHDFTEPTKPFAKRYAHRDDVLSYHMRFSGLWLSHPGYTRVYGRAESTRDEAVTVLRKQGVIEVMA